MGMSVEQRSKRSTASIAYDIGDAKYRTTTPAEFRYIVIVLLVAMITCGLQAEIMGDAAPTIARRFDAGLKLSWMASSGFLVQVCSLLIFGKLYDLLEPKRLVLVSNSCFLTGTIISATSGSYTMLVGGQALAGLGRSGITVGAIMILGIVCPERPRRALYVSIVTGSYGLMLKLAPLVSGLILRNHGRERWRMVFWICVPFQISLLILVSAFPILRRRQASWKQCREFDFFGAILQALGLAILIVPLLVGTSKGFYAWQSTALVILYASSPFVLLGFIFWEKRKEESRRFIPLAAIDENRSIWLLAIVAACSSFIIAAVTFFLPPYLQIVRDSSPLISATQMLPSIFIGSFASLGVGKLLALPHPRLAQHLCIIGSILQVMGGIIFWYLPLTSHMAGFYMNSLIIGLGAGSLFSIGITLVLEILPESAYGQAAAFMTAATAIGSVMGIALQGIIIQTSTEKFFDRNKNLDMFALTSYTTLQAQHNGDIGIMDNKFAEFQGMYHQTQRQSSLLYAAVGALSLLASLVLKEHRPNSEIVPKEVGVDEHDAACDLVGEEPEDVTKDMTRSRFGRLSDDLTAQLAQLATPSLLLENHAAESCVPVLVASAKVDASSGASQSSESVSRSKDQDTMGLAAEPIASDGLLTTTISTCVNTGGVRSSEQAADATMHGVMAMDACAADVRAGTTR